MLELQAGLDSFPAWKAILWCFYPLAIVLLIECFSSGIDDDDDHDGGKMVPAMQIIRS